MSWGTHQEQRLCGVWIWEKFWETVRRLNAQFYANALK
jgi:hypothetical protein